MIGYLIDFMWGNWEGYNIIDSDIKPIIEASKLLIENGSVRYNAIFDEKVDFVVLSYRKAYNKEYAQYRANCYRSR